MLCQKHLFSLEPEYRYINGAYMSPSLKSVEAAGIRGVMAKSKPYHIASSDFFADTERLRGLFAQLVNAQSPENVAIVPSVSYGMAIVAKNLRARAGQKIVLAESQFPSNVYPWMALAAETGIELQFVEMPSERENRGKTWNERLLEAIDERTAMVAIGHVHWANGTKFDLESIGKKVRAHGGWLVVDGTQSVGALPMDVQKFGLDALVCAGYKWLLGPYSLGYAYFGKAFADASPIEENWINRKNSQDFAGLVNYQSDYQPGALRFDAGERSNFALTPMAIAALEQLLEWGPGNIQDYCRELTSEAVKALESKGYWIENQAFRSSHLFGLQMPNRIAPEALQQKLQAEKIMVSVRGDFVRIAPNVYNDEADIEALTAVLLGL